MISKLKKLFIKITLLSVCCSAYADNAYVAEFGVSKIIPAATVYPDFKQSGPVINSDPNDIILVVIASTKDLKINAGREFFEKDPAFKGSKISYDPVQVSSDIAPQPVGLKSGLLGALNRINNARAMQQQIYTNSKVPIYYVAIENFVSELPATGNPTDHAVVMIEGPDAQRYIYLSEGVEIAKPIYEIVITPGNMTMGGTGARSTIGDFLAFTYKVNPSDWFGYVTNSNYTRQQQIQTALDYAIGK